MAESLTTPQKGARLDQVVTIYLSPKDLLEMYETMRGLWAVRKPGDETFVREWRGDNCKIQFKMDAFRTEGVYGKPGTPIPPVTTLAPVVTNAISSNSGASGAQTAPEASPPVQNAAGSTQAPHTVTDFQAGMEKMGKNGKGKRKGGK